MIQIPKIELLSWLQDMNQTKLAAAMGITEGRLSEYLSGKRPIGPTAVRQFAKALGTTPEKLAKGKNLSIDQLKDELRERLLEDEPVATEAPARHLTPVADEYPLDDALECIASIAQDDAIDQVAIPIWPEEIAATGLASNDPGHGQEQAWVPASMRKIYGAKLRAVRVAGRSMVKAGILPGSVAFLRKSTSSKDGDIIVLQQDGGATLKRRRGKLAVAESDQRYSDIVIGDEGVSQGVVVAVYRPAK